MGIFTKLFGGSRSKQESGNKSYDYLKGQLGGQIGNAGGASDSISAMLGVGGDVGAQTAAFDNYKKSIGYDFMLDSGISAIKGGNASQGLFNSGATGKALMGYGQNLAQTTTGDYIKNLLGLGQMGNQAAGILSGAGSWSKGNSSNDTGALGKTIGAIFASERRLKQNIEKLGEFEDGLGIYAFEYKTDPGIVHIGTMVDEVENLRPWALGPVTDEGIRTVDYAKLGDE